MEATQKIGLGGGCHWCTEAVFQAVIGVKEVEQGYLSSSEEDAYAEGILVTFDPEIVSEKELIDIHVHTHSATLPNIPWKYRSAVYFLNPADESRFRNVLKELQKNFKDKLRTLVLPVQKFVASREPLRNYYRQDPDRPFCTRYIKPKMRLLHSKFPHLEKISSR